jgi:hypothetical protein
MKTSLGCGIRRRFGLFSSVLSDTALVSQLSQGGRKIACGPFDSISYGFKRIDLSSRTNGHNRERILNEFDEPGRLSFSFFFATAHLAG